MPGARFWLLGCFTIGILACHDEPTAPVASGISEATQALTNVPLYFSQVSAGYSKACGVTTDHRAYCWRVGEWKPGDEPFVAYPVPGGLSFRQVSVSKWDDRHFCGVTTGNLAYCWGDNAYGQLGDGTLISRSAPVRVAGGRQFLSITAGGAFTCAINLYNRVFCWGDNSFGQIGDGSTGNPTMPVRVQTTKLFSEIRAGLEHICGVTTDAHAYCWGRDDENQLGDGTPAHRNDTVPTPVVGARLYKRIDAGVDQSCALSTSNVAFCWGTGISLGLGAGTGASQPVPARVLGGLQFTQLSTALDHTCALTFDRQAYCWGRFLTGRLDGSGPVISFVPVAVMSDFHFTQISPGANLTCGILPTSRAVCWGLGYTDGRLRWIHAVM